MTSEQLTQIPFTFVSHWSLSDCHIATYENKEYGIIREQSTKKKNDFEFGRTTEKFKEQGEKIDVFLDAGSGRDKTVKYVWNNGVLVEIEDL